MRFFLVLLSLGCGPDTAAILVSGETPYARCWAVEAESRELVIDDTENVVAFAGPRNSRIDLDAVEALDPGVILILGDLGAAAAYRRPRAPVLFIAGGADRHPVPRGIVDASRLRVIRIGDRELVPLAGAPARYAAGSDACGYSSADLARIAAEVPASDAPRTLVSWAGPSPGPALEGIDGGSPLVARFARDIGADGTLFAWPREAPGALGPIGGPWPILSDGTRRRPGPTLLRFDRHGVLRPHSP